VRLNLTAGVAGFSEQIEKPFKLWGNRDDLEHSYERSRMAARCERDP
jgi:hypothetical protein